MVPDWDTYFLHLAREIAVRSKDPHTQVGAIIVGPEHREIRATGYNGFPRRIPDTPPERWNPGEKQKRVVHAEANAIVAAARVGTPVAGCVLYTSLTPCLECTKLIVQAGIARVIVDGDFMDAYVGSGWLTDDIRERIFEMFREALVSVSLHRFS